MSKETLNVADMVSQLSEEDKLEIAKILGLTKRAVKPRSPELVAAETALDEFVEANSVVIEEYEKLKELKRAAKGTRKITATKQYNFDSDTGVISDKVTGENIATFGEEGWQSAVRGAGFTPGQVSAIAKKVRSLNATV